MSDIALDPVPVEVQVAILKNQIQMLTNTIFLERVVALADKQLEVPNTQEAHKKTIEDHIKRITIFRKMIEELEKGEIPGA